MNLDDQTRAGLRYLGGRFALFLMRVLLTAGAVIVLCRFL
jgi:hypothetical protein